MGYQALLFCPDEKTARTVTQVLRDLDFTVEPCTEPFAAVKKLMAQHFDAVVVDCDNEQNATLLFKSARTSNLNQSALAVAVVEGQAGVAKAFRIGANLVLTKPINVEQAKGTLRVARGLLRKGGDAPKPGASVVPAATPTGATARPTPPAPKPGPSSGATSSSSPGAASNKPSHPVIPFQRSAAPATPSIAASAQVAEMDEQDSDGILEIDDSEAMPEQVASETKPTPPATSAPPTGTAKFPWQPSAKMAEPMASALRRAAEAAGQVEASDATPPKPVASSSAPATAPEKRPMTGAMFQAQGHAAAPARAAETPASATVATPTVGEMPSASKHAMREVAASRPESSLVVDTTRDDVAPPTFFPGSYDPDEVEGGGKTKAIVIVAAVVLLAASAGYLSWKNAGGKNAAPTTTSQGLSTTPGATPNTHDNSISSEPGATDITLAGTGTGASAPHAAPSKPSPKIESEPPSEPEPQPEVTQRLIVKSDARRPAPAANPQDQEAEQAPSAIGMGASADPKALASISSGPISVPKASPQLLRVSQGVMEGLVLKRVQPRYPTQALQMRIQGPVQLQATISKTGDIGNLKVVSGDAVLARAAQEAVKQWKYKPYYLNGEPVQIETQILVNFRLPN
jgi:protein TonB